LQYTPRCFAGAKSLYPYSSPQVFIRAGELTRYRFRGQFNADFALHRTYFVDIYLHNPSQKGFPLPFAFKFDTRITWLRPSLNY
jgi:hypothetical protein